MTSKTKNSNNIWTHRSPKDSKATQPSTDHSVQKIFFQLLNQLLILSEYLSISRLIESLYSLAHSELAPTLFFGRWLIVGFHGLRRGSGCGECNVEAPLAHSRHHLHRHHIHSSICPSKPPKSPHTFLYLLPSTIACPSSKILPTIK